MHHHGTRRVPRWCPIGDLRCRRERYTDSERVSNAYTQKYYSFSHRFTLSSIRPPLPRGLPSTAQALLDLDLSINALGGLLGVGHLLRTNSTLRKLDLSRYCLTVVANVGYLFIYMGLPPITVL